MIIDFEECPNFRDLGGYATADGHRVRSGQLFRSMTPEYMTEGDLLRARDDLNIRLVMDLRDAPERDSGPLGKEPAQRYVLDFVEMANSDTLRVLAPVEALPLHLDLSSRGIATAVSLLAEERDGAALFHCQTGKDRTGVLAAVLLRLLGVSQEDALENYLAGTSEYEAVLAVMRSGGRVMSDRAPLHAKMPPVEDAMQAMLTRLDDEFGGARAFVRSQGVSDETIDRFVARMIE